MQQVTRTEDAGQTLNQLRKEHAELDGRLVELERKAWLSTAEEQEVRRLKKLKLLKKDQISMLERHAGTA
jgi:hypothetical protein